MVRLNFDYSNRASSGLKLGQSIATDLRKKTEKLYWKVNESLPPSANAESPAKFANDRPVRSTVSKIEVKVPGKELTEEGFRPVADALQDALRLCPELALIELNLSGNKLTPWAIARLSPIIELARFDLQIINISDNNLELLTERHEQQWEKFLTSFEHCRSLRVFNLGNNPLIGHRALEIFTRVYAQERPVQPIEASSVDVDDSGSKVRAEGQLSIVDEGRAGLRSIPYLIFRNIGLGDAGALFVATILKIHYYPAQLIPCVDVRAPGRVSIGHNDNPISGIDWSLNDSTLSRDGHSLLEAAVMIRGHIVGHRDPTLATSEEDIVDESRQTGSPSRSPSRKQNIYTFPTLSQITEMTRSLLLGQTTWSLRQLGTLTSQDDSETSEHQTEFDRACKKIERNVLVEIGPKHIVLWRSALAYLVAARKLLLCTPYQLAVGHTDSPSSGQQSTACKSDGPSTPESTHHLSYAAKLALMPVQMSDTGLDGFDEGSTSCHPVHDDRGYSLDKFVKEPQAMPKEYKFQKLDAVVRCESVAERFVKWQNDMLQARRTFDEGASDGYRDTSLGCQLPLPICVRILGHVVSKDSSRILSPQQQRKVIEWSQWRGSLTIEKHWRAKDEGSQLWLLLEGIECLAY